MAFLIPSVNHILQWIVFTDAIFNSFANYSAEQEVKSCTGYRTFNQVWGWEPRQYNRPDRGASSNGLIQTEAGVKLLPVSRKLVTAHSPHCQEINQLVYGFKRVCYSGRVFHKFIESRSCVRY